MKSILVGNGINIQFGGKDYTGYHIMERLLSNVNQGRYDEYFGDNISSLILSRKYRELKLILKDIVNGIYDGYAFSDDEKCTLIEIKKRYNSCDIKINTIGLEDYFFCARMLHNSRNDSAKTREGIKQGLLTLFVDSIYNQGCINRVYQRAPEGFKNYLSKIDNIFTVNYDTNLETLSKKQVYHIHGDFVTPDITLDISNLIGQSNDLINRIPKYPQYLKHACNSNAIMGFSGMSKMEIINLFNEFDDITDKFMITYNSDEVTRRKVAKCKGTNPFLYNLVMGKIEHPEMKLNLYPINEFKNIEDELVVLGLSPNNDVHLFSMIQENSKIKKVIYYYKCNSDIDAFEEICRGKEFEPLQVDEYLWNKL